MQDHTPDAVERHCDVVVVGGSAAGLAAALQLGRQGRSVIVVDAGEPRSAPEAQPHGVLSRDGTPPSAPTDLAREEARSHGSEVIDGRAIGVTRAADDRFKVDLVGGHSIVARRVLAATGLVDDRPRIDDGAVVLGARFRARAEPFVPLGLRPATHPSGLGDIVETDATGQTSVPGLYAAGTVTDPDQQVSQAAADGSRVGGMISSALADDDLGRAAGPSANATDWDRRYGDNRIWSGNPNGSLVEEVDGLTTGRALDVGAGEGGDAIWLAEQGWAVTASDISRRALDRIDAEARRRGLHVVCHHADANARGAFAPATFDLVTASYASIPRTADGRGVRNLLDAVAPGGTLLVISHDLEPMRTPIDTTTHSRMFDPDAYLRVDDIAAELIHPPGWTLEVHEKRPRPAGAASAAHHVDDIVLRARRHPR